MLSKYLEFRFKKNNVKGYHHFFKEWLDNVTSEQISYFELEMYKLIKNNIYDPKK